MTKISKTLLAVFLSAGMAFSSVAGNSSGSPGALNLNVKAKMKTERPVAKKSPQGLRSNSEMVVKAPQLEGKRVTGMQKADALTSIEGTWTFTLGDYYFQSSVGGNIQVEFKATLNGSQVTFQDPTGNELPFVATFNSATNKLTFGVTYLGTASGYYIYQQPFEYNYTIQDLDEIDSIIGTYNPNAGSITFTSDQGLEWLACSSNNVSSAAGYFGIYDLVRATYKVVSTEPIDEVEEGKWKDAGTAKFVDAWVLASYSMGGVAINPNDYEYEVELQQDVNNPKRYRLWKPFKTKGALVYDQGLNDSAYDGQIVFDISDPNNVIVECVGKPSGFKNSQGEFYVSNLLGWAINYGMTKDAAVAQFFNGKYSPDTYINNVVTINNPTFDFDNTYSNGYNWNNVNYPSIITLPAPENVEPELVGTYDIYLQSVSLTGDTEDSVPVTIEVYKTNDTDYYIAEKGDTNYFHGNNINFTLNGDNSAVFEPYFAGEIDGKNAWINAFVFNGSITEPQPMYNVPFSVTDGLSFPEKSGIAWFASTGTEEFEPTSDPYISAYYFLKEPATGNSGGGDEEGGNYPTSLTVFNGTHQFKADVTFTDAYKNISTVTEYIKDAVEFEITGGSSLSGFVGNGNSMKLTYDNKTGVITLGTNVLGSTMDYNTYQGWDFGYAAADGTWNGTTVAGGTAPTWNAEEGDHIRIPDFAVVNYRVSPAQVVAYFTNCTVDGYPEGGNTGGGDDDEDNGPFPEISSLEGTYPFTSDLEILDNSYSSSLTGTNNLEFTIEKSGTNEVKIMGFVLSGDYFSIFAKYDQDAGTLTFTSNNGPIKGTYTYAGILDANQEWGGTSGNNAVYPVWKVKSDGTIVIPDFYLGITGAGTTYNKIAKYSNCKVGGDNEDPGTGDEETYPTAAELAGTYPFKATRTFMGSANVKATRTAMNKAYAEYEQYLPESFEFTITENANNVQGFFIPTIGVKEYNEETGVLTLNTNYGKLGTSDYTIGLANIEGEWKGIGSINSTFAPWQVEKDGTITIQDFTIVDYSTYNKNNGTPATIIAKYTNVVVGEDEGEDPGTGEEPGDDKEYPAAGTFNGDYTYKCANFTLKDDTYAEYLKADVPFTITSSENSNTGEVSLYVGNFFVVNNGAEYNEETGVLTLNTVYFKPTGAPANLGIAPVEGGWTGMSSLTSNKMKWQIGEDGSITVPDFDIVTFNGNTRLETIAEYRNGVVVAPGDEPVEYPAAGDFDGTYKFAAADFTLGDNAYSGYFTQDFEFEIKTTFQTNTATQEVTPNIMVNNFLYDGLNGNSEYDEETGVLTLKLVTLRPNGVNWLAIAPEEGGYTGMSASNANYLKIQIGENGSVSIPDFSVGPYSASGLTSKTASWSNITVTKADGEGPGGGEEPASKFAGTYALKGTKYEYPNGVKEAPVTSEFNFDLVITDDNRIAEMAGYKVDPELLNGLRNLGTVKGNTLTWEADTYLGLKWEMVGADNDGDSGATGFQEAYLLSGTNLNEWSQIATSGNTFTFTLNDDGTYSLSPFTLWYRHQDTSGENAVTVFDLQFMWNDTPYEGGDEPDPDQPGDFDAPQSIVGEWNIPIYDHYQGEYSLKETTVKYKAVLNDKTVTFYDEYEEQPMVAEFTSPTTLKFSKALVGNAIAKYPLHQIPFLNTTGTDDMDMLTEESFTAIYDAEAGTITFPEYSGMLYGYMSTTGELGYWANAFDFNGPATQTSTGVKPEIKLNSQTFEIGKNSVTVSVEVELSYMQFSDVAKWTAQVNELFNDVAGETEWTESTTVDVTVKDGVATFTIPDLANGNHDFQYSLTAFAADDSNIATSNTKALSVVVGPNIMARNIQAEVDGGDITFSLSAIISGIDPDELGSYKMRLLDNNTVTEDYAGDTQLIDAEYDETDGLYKAVLADQPNGRYDFTVVLLALDTQDNEIIASNNLLIVVDVTESGVSIIGADNNGDVRYFDLNGIEVRNPENGIYIKVEGNKASKVIIKK